MDVSGVVEISAAAAAAAGAPTTQHTPVNAPVVDLNKRTNIDEKMVQERMEKGGKTEVILTMPGRLDKTVKAKKEGSEVL
eukprot:evm.model.NODE_40244_length_10419_cov_22.187637.3